MKQFEGELSPMVDSVASKKELDAEKKTIKLPSDFETEADFVSFARKLYSDDVEGDRRNREPALEDAEFVIGEQWDDTTKARRIRAKKPVLTVNRLPAYVGLVVGNRRLNETVINVLPQHDGTKRVAEVRKGLIRSIEQNSKAERAYDKALENAVIGGLGVFLVSMKYARYDVFEQDLFVDEVANPFSVVFDRLGTDSTGADCGHCFVVDTIPLETYRRKYPGTTPADLDSDPDLTAAKQDGWFTADDVRVVSFWRMRTEPARVALKVDGTICDITKYAEDDPRMAEIAINEKTGEPYIRETERPFCEMYLMSGTDLLAGPYRLPISRIPAFRVPGWEINVGHTRHRFGLIRFMKDPQRLHNYWRSVIAEKLMMAPRARWSASAESVAGREKQWRNAHLSDDPLLIWNGDSGQPPVFTPPAQLESALLQEANMSVQDLRDVSNLHEASFGQQSNEVSGKAILARQRVGEVGTVIYNDNLKRAQEEAGAVLNELIPVCYDTPRTIRTLGDGMKEKFVRVNDASDPDSVDIGVGRYSTSISTGPSYATRRVEAQEAMLAVFNAAPQMMQVAADLYVEAQDWPGAEKFAARLRRTIPANLIGDDELTTEEQAQQQQQKQQEAEQQAKEQAYTEELAMAELRLKNAEATKTEADAAYAKARVTLANAQATKTLAEAEHLDDPDPAAVEGGVASMMDALREDEQTEGTDNDD